MKFEIGQRVIVTKGRNPEGMPSLGWIADYGGITGFWGDSFHGEIMKCEGYGRNQLPIYSVRLAPEHESNTTHWWCHEHWIEPEGGPW